MARRSYGTGSLFTYRGSWYGQWRSDGRLVKRKIGPKRPPGTREGLTQAQAEKELRRQIDAVAPTAPVDAGITIQTAGDSLIAHLTSLQRKPTTITDYRSYLRVQLV